MNLKDYLTREKIPYTIAAKQIGCDRSTIFRIVKEINNTSYDVASRIQEYTNGEVTIAELMSDKWKKTRCPMCGKLYKEKRLRKIGISVK